MRQLIIAISALTVLAGCTSQASVAPTSSPASQSTAQARVASPQSTPETAKEVSFSSPAASKSSPKSQASSLFNFPLASCGDKPSEGADAWYPVFVDGGDLETIRRNFCVDAVSTVRKDSGVQSVQLASFNSRLVAAQFAEAVGGDVGQPTYPNAVSSSPQPQAETISSTAVDSLEAVLTADDPDSQINLRESPSATGRRKGYGLVGDRVIVIKQSTADGSIWYQVRFPESGAQGWIRGDFVSVGGGGTNQQTSEPTTSFSSSDTTYTASATGTSSGACNSPDDLDSRGRRCGGRAKGFRSGQKRH